MRIIVVKILSIFRQWQVVKCSYCCEIGQNIMINPDGSSYPCYAWCGEHTFISNVFEKGLKETLKTKEFTRLFQCIILPSTYMVFNKS